MNFRTHLNTLFYVVGSLCFICGSILFHPDLFIDEKLFKIAVFSFAFGSFLFLSASFQQLIETFQIVIFKSLTLSNETNEFHVDLAISLCRHTTGILSGILFFVGSAAYWPTFGSSGVLVGNWFYRFGAIYSFLSSFVSLIRQQQKSSTLSIAKFVTFFSLLGSIAFLIGGALFLAGQTYFLQGCITWIVGSTAYLLSSLLIYKI